MKKREGSFNSTVLYKLIFVSASVFAVIYAFYRWVPWDAQEFSGALHEEATVVETIHTPAKHEMHVRPKIGPSFGAIPIGSGLEISSSTIPETFGVMFRCQHGEFVVHRKELYDTLLAHKGKRVLVSYREVYTASYRGNGPYQKLVSRTLVKYDFLDAKLK